MLGRVSGLQNDANTSARLAGTVTNPLKSLARHIRVVTGDKRKYLVLVVIPVVITLITGLVYAFQSGKQNSNRRLTANFSDQQSASSGNASNQNPNDDESQRQAGDETSNGTSSANNTSSTSVTINGQSVAVPKNGSYSQTIENPDGSKTTVRGENSQNSNSASGSAHNSSSTTVNINSSTGGE